MARRRRQTARRLGLRLRSTGPAAAAFVARGAFTGVAVATAAPALLMTTAAGAAAGRFGGRAASWILMGAHGWEVLQGGTEERKKHSAKEQN